VAKTLALPVSSHILFCFSTSSGKHDALKNNCQIPSLRSLLGTNCKYMYNEDDFFLTTLTERSLVSATDKFSFINLQWGLKFLYVRFVAVPFATSQ